MTNFVLSLLLTALPITGNQIAELDFRIQVLGELLPGELCAERFSRPFVTPAQLNNFAIVCATLDWDATLMFTTHRPAMPHDLQVFSSYYLTLPESSNSTKFLRFHANAWQTNWTAGSVEEGVLRRLKVVAAAEADAFFMRLAANPENIPQTRWYSWYNLILDRRKAEAHALAARERVNTTNSFGVAFPCPSFEMPRLQVLWPHLTRTDLYQYYFPGQSWTFNVVPSPAKPVFLPADWTPPKGEQYKRSWQRGPSWQVTYTHDGQRLTRTATYVETDSCIAGTVRENGFVEDIVEITAPPQRYVQKAPHFVEVH